MYGTCDWGHCDEPADAYRWSEEYGWLPVCPTHGGGNPAPWPVVGECHGHRDGSTCLQCDGSHDHEWAAWRGAPRVEGLLGTSVVGGHSGPGIPVRCRICGGRKCDVPVCVSRRHHLDPHTTIDGEFYKVGV